MCLILRYWLGCVNLVGREGSVSNCWAKDVRVRIAVAGLSCGGRFSLARHAQQPGILRCSRPLTEIIDMTEQFAYTHH